MKIFSSVILALLISVLPTFSADMRFIQVSDLAYPNTQFERMVKDINKQKNVEFVVFTGNNISKANEENLKGFLKTAKSLNSPFYIVLGNKDVNKQKKLGKVEYLKVVSKLNRTHKNIESPSYVFEKNKVVFIVVDGSKDVIPDSVGYYRAQTLEWLNNELEKYKDRNVVILQHFPIIPPVIKDFKMTYKADEYLNLLSKHKNVKAVISGDYGVNKEQEVNGILHVSTANAPTYRIIDILDCDTKNPTFWSTIMH